MVCGVILCSVALAMSSRSSVRKDRRPRTASPRCSGHSGPVPSSTCPARSAATSASCSAPVSSVGGSAPARIAACATMSKASDDTVRARGPLTASPMRRPSRSRSRVALALSNVRASTDSGANPQRCTRSASNSTRVVVLPVPGAPTTSADACASMASTARCEASRSPEVSMRAVVSCITLFTLGPSTDNEGTPPRAPSPSRSAVSELSGTVRAATVM